MKFFWLAHIVALSTAVAVVGIAYLFGDHNVPGTAIGFFVVLAVFIAGVEHLSEKADEIKKAVRAALEEAQEAAQGNE